MPMVVACRYVLLLLDPLDDFHRVTLRERFQIGIRPLPGGGRVVPVKNSSAAVQMLADVENVHHAFALRPALADLAPDPLRPGRQGAEPPTFAQPQTFTHGAPSVTKGLTRGYFTEHHPRRRRGKIAVTPLRRFHRRTRLALGKHGRTHLLPSLTRIDAGAIGVELLLSHRLLERRDGFRGRLLPTRRLHAHRLRLTPDALVAHRQPTKLLQSLAGHVERPTRSRQNHETTSGRRQVTFVHARPLVPGRRRHRTMPTGGVTTLDGDVAYAADHRFGRVVPERRLTPAGAGSGTSPFFWASGWPPRISSSIRRCCSRPCTSTAPSVQANPCPCGAACMALWTSRYANTACSATNRSFSS